MTQEVYCKIRKKWVASFPEERVRQALVERMLTSLEYPYETLAIEKLLHQFPHLSLKGQNIPERRADLVCFAKGIQSSDNLSPLLVIECKSVKLTANALQQVISYNLYIQAPFIAVANQKEIFTGWFDSLQKKYHFIPTLPSYKELIQGLN